MRRMVGILVKFTMATGHPHPHLRAAIGNYRQLLAEMGWSEGEIRSELEGMGLRAG